MSAQEKARTRAGQEPLDIPEKQADRSARFSSPQALQHWFESRITRELERCRSCMSEAAWTEHREWIEEYARLSLREAIEQLAAQGAL